MSPTSQPFRERNGRLARVFSTLMVLEAGWPLLDSRSMIGECKLASITAIRAGLDKDYAPMERLFEQIIEESGRA